MVVKLFGTGLNQSIIFIAKVLCYALAIVLFFITFKKRRRLSIYFSLYIFCPLLTIAIWAFDGIMGSILAAVFIFAFSVPNVAFKDGKYTFQNSISGSWRLVVVHIRYLKMSI